MKMKMAYREERINYRQSHHDDGAHVIHDIIERCFKDKEVSISKKEWLRESFNRTYVKHHPEDFRINASRLIAAVFCDIR